MSDPWAEYQSAAQRLDTVRRAASTLVGDEAQTVHAAQQEVSAVRARLAPQRARLVGEFGVPEGDVVPRPADLDAAAQAAAGGPAAALAAVRRAQEAADAADVAMLPPPPGTAWTPWMRNLLVYGPFAATVLIVQVVLYLVASSDSLPVYALLCGLMMPVLAFGLAWVTIGFVFGGQGAAADRTPVIGALVCVAPVVVTCMGVGLLAIVR